MTPVFTRLLHTLAVPEAGAGRSDADCDEARDPAAVLPRGLESAFAAAVAAVNPSPGQLALPVAPLEEAALLTPAPPVGGLRRV